MHKLTTVAGEVHLKRFPAAHDPTLKAWDAADQWLIDRVYDLVPQDQSILVLNDEFGALSTALSANYQITHWNDSLVSQLAMEKNLTLNGYQGVHFVPSTELPDGRKYHLILVRPSKNLRLLQYQLNQLSQVFSGVAIWVGEMQKHITSGLKQCLNAYLDELNPGRSERKARIITGILKNAPFEREETFRYFEYRDVKLANMANVFSSESIDIGARFFIEQFSRLPNAEHIADLGCGNGALSVFASQKLPNAQLTGFDESYMAVASAKETFARNQLTQGHFVVSNLLNEAEDETFDLILCNPPFHQQRRVTTDTARHMIKQAKFKLKPKGELWVVANRHLNYHIDMKRTFGNLETLNANPKFVVLRSQKR